MKPRAKCPVCGMYTGIRGRAGSHFELAGHVGRGPDGTWHAPFVPLSAIREWAGKMRARLAAAGDTDEIKRLDAMLKRTDRAVAQHEEVVALRKKLGLPPL